jgi:hypothetical protein
MNTRVHVHTPARICSFPLLFNLEQVWSQF